MYEMKHYEWSYSGEMRYSDSFRDPADVMNWPEEPNVEVPGGVPYDYGHTWSVNLNGKGVISRVIE